MFLERFRKEYLPDEIAKLSAFMERQLEGIISGKEEVSTIYVDGASMSILNDFNFEDFLVDLGANDFLLEEWSLAGDLPSDEEVGRILVFLYDKALIKEIEAFVQRHKDILGEPIGYRNDITGAMSWEIPVRVDNSA